MKRFLPALAAVVVGLVALSGCTSSQTALNAQCPSKWAGAGDNGAKADRYYHENCNS